MPAQQIYTGRALGASSPQHDDVGSGDIILMGSSSKGLSRAGSSHSLRLRG